MHSETPETVYLKDYRPPDFSISAVELSFTLNEETTTVRSRLHLCRRAGLPADTPLVLDGEGLELLALVMDNERLADSAFRVDENYLTIFHAPENCILEIETRIRPQDNTKLEGLYRSSGNFCTQCEAEGFRRITYYLDRSDVLARFTTTIEADKSRYPVLLANGNLVASGDLPGNRHFATWHDPFPKPSYLFALVAGDLVRIADSFATRSGREVLLEIYVQAHNQDKCGHAMISLKKAMAWEEEVYGLEYDLDRYMIVAVDDFNMGAMENKGLNVFNSKYVLARPDTATDTDYENIEAVIAHEYFHNWTGNRVTCRDWFQLSLKEGLTVFRDQQFSADMGSHAVKRIDDVRLLRDTQFSEDAGPMAHPVRPESYIEINNFYTVTVYEKGAEIIRMLHTLLGSALFRAGVRRYLELHDGTAATTDDFVAAMAEVSGRDLSQFRRWYSQAGTPVLEAASVYDPEQRSFSLTLRQSCPPSPGQPVKEPFHLPVAIGLLAQDGRELALQLAGESAPAAASTRLLELTEPVQTFVFVNVPERPVLSLLRDFSAPVRLVCPVVADDLRVRLAHDPDPFNRWEAGQTLAMQQLQGLISACERGEELRAEPGFYLAFGQALQDVAGSDGAFGALLLTLPSEKFLADGMAIVDVDGVHQARQFLRRGLASSLREEFLQVYQASRVVTPYCYEPSLAGRRSLRNLCLAYLMALEDGQALELCQDQYRTADNMTDRMGALRPMAHSSMEEKEEMLADFHVRWQDDPLVLDKWFSLQATAPLPDTLSRVQRLMADPAFSIKNPNRVRALIGAFAAANPVCFHAASGAGYAFLGEQVLALDLINSQIAARLLGNFSRWRRFDASRQALMQAELERVAARPGLSRDVYEVACKSLA